MKNGNDTERRSTKYSNSKQHQLNKMRSQYVTYIFVIYRNADETETMKKVLQNLLQNCHCDIDTKDSSLVEMIENVESVTFQLQKRL